jgi:hypothetical protein
LGPVVCQRVAILGAVREGQCSLEICRHKKEEPGTQGNCCLVEGRSDAPTSTGPQKRRKNLFSRIKRETILYLPKLLTSWPAISEGPEILIPI